MAPPAAAKPGGHRVPIAAHTDDATRLSIRKDDIPTLNVERTTLADQDFTQYSRFEGDGP